MSMWKEVITMQSDYKFVEFEKYCHLCKYDELEETEMPCYNCLNHAINLYSHKPINFKERRDVRNANSKKHNRAN